MTRSSAGVHQRRDRCRSVGAATAVATLVALAPSPAVTRASRAPATAVPPSAGSTHRVDRCRPRRHERVALRAPSLVVIGRSVAGFSSEVSYRWSLCDRRNGRRSELGEQVDNEHDYSGMLRGFVAHGRTVAWIDVSTTRFGPASQTVKVRRLGGRTRSFAVPFGRTSGSFDFVHVGRLRLSSAGVVAFIASGRTYGDIVWTLGADGVGRRVDATPPRGITSVRWDDAVTLTWHTAGTEGSATVPLGADPCLERVRFVFDATLNAVRGTDRSATPFDPVIGCLRSTGAPVPLPGPVVGVAAAGSIGLAGPFAVQRDRTAADDGGTITVIDLRTGRPTGPARPYTGADPTVLLAPDGGLTVYPGPG